MNLKERFAKARLKKKELRRETKAFKSIVEKREMQARRQSYEKEAIKQAELKGKRLAEEKANKPSFFGRAVSAVDRATGVTQKRKVAVRRAPLRRKKMVYVTKPLAKRRKRKVVKKATSQPKQDNLYSDILGF